MIKKLSKSLREYKKESILTVVCMVVEAAMEVLIPLIIFEFGKCVNPSTGGDPDINGMIRWGIFMVLAAIVSLVAGMLGGKFCAEASAGFAKNLRYDMFTAVQGYSFKNIDKFSSSSLVTRLTTDVTNVQMAFMMLIRTAIRSPLMLIFSIVMSFAIDTSLPWIFFVTTPILVFALSMMIKCAMPIFKKVFKRYDALNESIQENVKGMRVVKAYVREKYETEKFSKVSNELCKDFTKAERILAINSPVMNMCLQGAILAITYFGARIIMGGSSALNTLGLQSLMTYSLQILFSLQMLSMIFVMLTMSAESGHRIVEVLEEKSTLTNPEHPVMEVKNGDVKFENVSFRYSNTAEKYALEDINLDIKSGETVGILGGTGSSKTTLVNLISRLYDVSKGSVKVGDVDVRDYDMEVLRNQVAVVLQKNTLFSGTIKDNLRWGDKNATDEEMVHACKLAQADEFIRQFPKGYDTMITQGGTNVSGGQKQRLCIARALLKKPKVLILDDSTSAVDMKTDALLRAAFRQYIPDTTKIIIAQRVASVMDADKIVIMNNGRIDDIGTHDELLKRNEIYREVYYSQNKQTTPDNEEGGALNG
ncbi:MAG TPA: ABC transporter ATP-binding protein/permease [Firmicutes bacterium]|nr:ABC transporter ATP-binding protein/permease [Bacillota bacterium]